MPLANTAARYGTIAKGFHWLVAGLILGQIVLGVVAERWPLETEGQIAVKATLFSTHKTLGIAIFALALARILWALIQPKPAPLHPERRAETFLADTAHWVLYAALVVVPLTGWVQHASSEGFAPIWWPLGQGLPLVPKSETVHVVAGTAHYVFVVILAGTIALHVAGALKHALIDRDDTLRRMWFGPARAEAPVGYPHETGAAMPLAAAIYAGGVVAVLVLAAPALTTAEDGGAIGAGAGNWQVREGRIEIAVQQFGSRVEGSFADWTADIAFSEIPRDGRHGTVRVEVAIESLTLGSVTQQALGPDYFAAADHPTAVFAAEIVPGDVGPYLAQGTLELAGETAGIELPFTLEIEGDTARMQGETVIDRRSFGIGAGQTDPATLGFDVPVTITLTAERVE
ncbi:cytochrome [Palleronia sediminis]|uniref:Cytochrome n=1 Tax=Palleronia sediminis TaxID=2547833 RepID=A0A4V3BAL5_9RHOB|nr:cytochrome b/b6 domain-containing protein [Palleronia sediminis]TDL83609.1 cytochrome [Palleronia sediminis]